MRSDMHKVIVERPRYGSRETARVKLRNDRASEQDRGFIGHRRHILTQGHDDKGSSDNLRPLARYLWKQRGRPWNKVYSEICAGSNIASTVQRHLREHLDDLVMLQLSRGRRGEWIYRGKSLAAEPIRTWYPPLYVDPRDGLLKDSIPFLRRFTGARR
jgi:hypothetical protein